MRILVIGGSRASNVEDALEQRFASIEVKTVRTIGEIKIIGSAGERFDRVLLFEQAITKDGIELSSKEVHENTQEMIKELQNAMQNFDLVCIADSNIVIRTLLEETFEMKYRSVVVEIKSNSISANTLAALISKSIGELKRTYNNDVIDTSIYRGVDTVLWSNEIDRVDDWGIGERGGTSLDIDEGMEFDPLTGSWKAKVEEKEQVNETEKQIEEDKKPKRKTIFGNRRMGGHEK